MDTRARRMQQEPRRQGRGAEQVHRKPEEIAALASFRASTLSVFPLLWPIHLTTSGSTTWSWASL